MSKKIEKTSTDDLIGQLCNELKPTCPRCPYRRISVWLILSIAYISTVVFYFGLKVNIGDHLTNASFLFEMGLAICIVLSSALASSWLSFPDSIQRDWMKVVSITLFGIFLFWIIVNTIEEGGEIFSSFYISSCSKGFMVEILPFVALIIMSAKGHTTQPYWSMTMNVMAVSALGWIGSRLTCSMYDSMSYGFLHYLLPFSILGVGVGFFARKLFKW